MSKIKVCYQCEGTGLFVEFDGAHSKCMVCKGRGVVNQARYEAMIDYWHGRALATAEDPISAIVRDRHLDELDVWWHEEPAPSDRPRTALGQALANVLGSLASKQTPTPAGGRDHV